jgi:hypothetical protein
MGGQHVGSEARLCAESCRSLVHEEVISRAWRFRQLRRENPHHRIRTLGEIRRARDDHRRSDLGLLDTGQNADHHIARLQSRSSDSSASSRRNDAALNSFKSSSDQESDQSIFRFGARSGNRPASADSSVAVSGGRRRKASTNDASRSLSCISISPYSVWRPNHRTGLPYPAFWGVPTKCESALNRVPLGSFLQEP